MYSSSRSCLSKRVLGTSPDIQQQLTERRENDVCTKHRIDAFSVGGVEHHLSLQYPPRSSLDEPHTQG